MSTNKKLVNQGMIQGVSSFVYRVDYKTVVKNISVGDVMTSVSVEELPIEG